MSQVWRWTLAVLLGASAVTVTWLLCQLSFGLDVATSVTIAALTATVLGTPIAAWAGAAPTSVPALPTEPPAAVRKRQNRV